MCVSETGKKNTHCCSKVEEIVWSLESDFTHKTRAKLDLYLLQMLDLSETTTTTQ